MLRNNWNELLSTMIRNRANNTQYKQNLYECKLQNTSKTNFEHAVSVIIAGVAISMIKTDKQFINANSMPKNVAQDMLVILVFG